MRDSHAQRLRESISDDIKKASNFHPHKMSKRARQAALALKPQIDLSRETWHEQHRFDPGRERFLVEHRATVSSLRARCLEQGSAEAVLDVLLREIEVVWILREEDEKLNELRYRSKRPSTAYDDAKIEIWNEDGEAR